MIYAALLSLILVLALGDAIAHAQDLDTPPLHAEGAASYYGESYRGQIMANGERFNPDAMTCAAWDWPLGTILRVTYAPQAGESRNVLVTVTDRGPAKRLNRKIDLSEEAFADLAPPSEGVIPVKIEVVSLPPTTDASVPTNAHAPLFALALGAAPILPIYHPMHAEVQLVASGAGFLLVNFLWQKWRAA
jgi:rare lipoprotein A